MDGDEDAGNNSSTDGETVVEGTCVDGADVEIPVIVTWLTEVTANSTLGEALDFFLDGPDDNNFVLRILNNMNTYKFS